MATKDSTDSDPNICESISFGRTHFITKGQRYDLDYHGNDLSDLYNHVALHLQYICTHTTHDGVHMYLFVPYKIDKEGVEDVVKRIKGLQCVGTPMVTYIIEGPWPNTDAAKL